MSSTRRRHSTASSGLRTCTNPHAQVSAPHTKKSVVGCICIPDAGVSERGRYQPGLRGFPLAFQCSVQVNNVPVPPQSHLSASPSQFPWSESLTNLLPTGHCKLHKLLLQLLTPATALDLLAEHLQYSQSCVVTVHPAVLHTSSLPQPHLHLQHPSCPLPKPMIDPSTCTSDPRPSGAGPINYLLSVWNPWLPHP